MRDDDAPGAVGCGLDPEAAAARLALAPASVQAFIQRWGRREGIDEAYSAACTMNWGTVVLESTDEVPGHHHESAVEAAFRERAEAGAEEEGKDSPAAKAARLALAPPSVRGFISRWGSRAGIKAAYEHAGRAPAVIAPAAFAAAASQPQVSCGLDPEAAAARLALAPVSVQVSSIGCKCRCGLFSY